MKLNEVFQKLWDDHCLMNPGDAERILTLLKSIGETPVNDHVAFRTFAYPGIDKRAMAQHFLDRGYTLAEELAIPEKKVTAWHLAPPTSDLPKVFLSELHAELVSKSLGTIIRGLAEQVPPDYMHDVSALWSGAPWEKIPYALYEEMRKESEYAAWMAVHGYHANHFTYLVNAMRFTQDIREVNGFLKGHGFTFSSSGGEVKGTPKELLEQSSTVAVTVPGAFSDGIVPVPGCYTEFAKRYPDASGNLFQGFIPSSANKIFESTDMR